MSNVDLPNELSTPVCDTSSVDEGYLGYLNQEELGELLNSLLEAERAGAQVGAGLVMAAPDLDFEHLSRAIQADEVRWCRMLVDALATLGVESSTKVGDFFEKASAIEDVEARLAFVNRGQAWVVRKLAEVLPKVRDEGLHANLKQMLEAHERNIARAERALARRRPAI